MDLQVLLKGNMCMCDDKYFKTTNTRTGVTKTYKRAASIARRFGLSKDMEMFVLRSENLRLILENDSYELTRNEHWECRKLRNKIITHFNRRPSYLTTQEIKQYRDYFDEHGL